MDLFEEVRARYTVSGVHSMLMSEKGPIEESQGKRVERNHFGTCPVCDSPRMQIGSKNTAWTCWAEKCHEQRGSDAVGMAAASWNVDRSEAAKRLLEMLGLWERRGDVRAKPADRFDVQPSKRQESNSRADSDDQPVLQAWQRDSWQAWIGGIIEKAHADLLDYENPTAREAQRYLRKERGIDGAMARTYKIGLIHHWKQSHDAIPGKKVVIAPGIVFPWTKPGGGYCGAIVRAFHVPLDLRYIMASGSTRRWMYPGPVIQETDAFDAWGYTGPLLVTEGEIDCLTAQRALAGLVAVKTIGSATSGPNALDSDEKLTLAAFTRILVAADDDKAGQECRGMWRAYSPRAVPVALPPGHKDLNAALVAGVDLRAWLMGELDRLGVSLNEEPGSDIIRSICDHEASRFGSIPVCQE